MDEYFREDERLFRAVRPGPMYWKDACTVSSAAFKTKEEDGLSTDRDGGRTVEECVKRLSDNLSGGVVSVDCSQCREADVMVKYAPVEYNEFHTLLRRNEENAELTKSQARALAKLCRIDKLSEETAETNL